MTKDNTTEATGQKSANTAVLVKNETPIPCVYASSVNFLSESPRGAYTTGRTVGRTAIFQFEFHVQRLGKPVNIGEADVGGRWQGSAEPPSTLGRGKWKSCGVAVVWWRY
eukprot:1196012-Prorocentrum_minimum.AAC.8